MGIVKTLRVTREKQRGKARKQAARLRERAPRTLENGTQRWSVPESELDEFGKQYKMVKKPSILILDMSRIVIMEIVVEVGTTFLLTIPNYSEVVI